MKRYWIAGLRVDMDVSGRTAKQAEPYRCDCCGAADIVLSCDADRLFAQNPGLGSVELAEYLGTGVLFARHLLNFGGLYLHSSAVALDGRAYLFSGPSGTGKSTHTKK